MTYDINPTEKYTLLDWVKEAKKGRAYLYYSGFICRDADKEKDNGFKIKAVRSLAWSLYEKGFVTLVQKRLGPMSYEYIAIRTNKQYK